MAYNALTGTVIAANKYLPSALVINNIVSGNLSTSDGSSIINVPRVSNATNNSILTNVDGDANSLTCESNLKFDGSTLSVTGHLTSSLSISASVYYGDGSMLSGISSSGGTSNRLSVYSIGDADGSLSVGLNYGSATFTSARTWTTPNSASVGDVIRIKAPAGVSGTNTLTVEGFDIHTIDGMTNIKIESPYGAVALCYVTSGSYRIF